MHPFLAGFLNQAAGDGSSGGPFGGLSLPVMLALMFGVFYFVLWRPQNKERKKLESFRQNMKKGDRIWTQGGLIGTVSQVEDQAVLLDVGAGKVRVLKSFVGGEFKEKSEVESAKAEARK
ncbi:MAG TPA: preprotein translocase subunit YajC [Anaeromyxobacteraceae bacterium]|nr:preprotein translocase subunit YajC [Anaeromyxobacteraceae bacterium]